MVVYRYASCAVIRRKPEKLFPSRVIQSPSTNKILPDGLVVESDIPEDAEAPEAVDASEMSTSGLILTMPWLVLRYWPSAENDRVVI